MRQMDRCTPTSPRSCAFRGACWLQRSIRAMSGYRIVRTMAMAGRMRTPARSLISPTCLLGGAPRWRERAEEIMKTCFKCGQSKPRSEFYAHPQMGDGLLGKCKACTKKDVMDRYFAKPDQIRKYEKERTQTPHRKEKARGYLKSHRARYPQKNAARMAVNCAVRGGKLKRLPCEICGNPKSEGHHEDYSKPLEVRWLCDPHHKAAHKAMKV